MKPTILKLKTHLNLNPEAETNYIIGGDFLKYHNKEDWEENINKKARYLIIYNQLIIKTVSSQWGY